MILLGKNSIDEAIARLGKNDFPQGINGVIFLLHKPVGQGSRSNVLQAEDPRVERFFHQFDRPHPFKMGLDSCNVPGAIRFCQNILPQSLDCCEGGRFSCYIGPDMVMMPCSFDQEKHYAVPLKAEGEGGGILHTVKEAWNSPVFEAFRDKMRKACPDCGKRDLCMGGCPLMPEIVFCDSAERMSLP